MPRMSVELSGKADERVETIARQLGVTKVEVVRRALAAYSYLDREARTKDGDIIVTVQKEDDPKTQTKVVIS
jgi:predicted transcriptional regulator